MTKKSTYIVFRLEDEEEPKKERLVPLEGRFVKVKGFNCMNKCYFDGVLTKNSKGDYVVRKGKEHIINISAYLRKDNIKPFFHKISITA